MTIANPGDRCRLYSLETRQGTEPAAGGTRMTAQRQELVTYLRHLGDDDSPFLMRRTDAAPL